MFIATVEEFNAGADQLKAYLLIENPTDEQKKQHSELAIYMDIFILAQPTRQNAMH